MKSSRIILSLFVSLFIGGCAHEEERVGASLGSGDEPQQMLTTDDYDIKESNEKALQTISIFDRTGAIENGCEGIIQLRNGRIVFQWHEDARSDYFAFIQDPSNGDTLRVLFEGATKKGIAEVSFKITALESGTYRWLLTRKVEHDTVQQVDFNIIIPF